MTDNIKLPPFPEGMCLREDIEDYAREAVRLNAKAEPAKSYLKVSYDKYGDCLYVVCDSNEPALSDEDDKGILYRRAISDGRLVGITILDFMGRHAKSPDEPVKAPSDDLAHEIWAAAQTAPGEGIGDAVERVAALLACYGQPT